MKFSYITIMIRDMEKALIFYQELAGLRVLRRFNPGPGEIVFLANAEGETMLELIEFEGVQKVETKGMVMSFQAEEPLEVVRKKAETMGYTPSAIIDKGPKPAFFTVPDPDGITIEFSV